MFTLHPQLEGDTFPICALSLCEVRLMNNAFFPWLILVPRMPGAREIIDLPTRDRAMLMEEIAQASEVLQQFYAPHKLNVAALGNKVEQLHVHVIARFTSDNAWPEPVWGQGCTPYEDAQPIIAALRQRLIQ